MSESFIIKTNSDGEIEIPGVVLPSTEGLSGPLSPEEEAEFVAMDLAITEASRPQPGDSDLRFGA